MAQPGAPPEAFLGLAPIPAELIQNPEKDNSRLFVVYIAFTIKNLYNRLSAIVNFVNYEIFTNDQSYTPEQVQGVRLFETGSALFVGDI